MAVVIGLIEGLIDGLLVGLVVIVVLGLMVGDTDGFDGASVVLREGLGNVGE